LAGRRNIVGLKDKGGVDKTREKRLWGTHQYLPIGAKKLRNFEKKKRGIVQKKSR